MSFFDIGTGLSGLWHAGDRNKDDRAALAVKLKAKLKELRAAGLELEPDEDEDFASAKSQRPGPVDIVAS